MGQIGRLEVCGSQAPDRDFLTTSRNQTIIFSSMIDILQYIFQHI